MVAVAAGIDFSSSIWHDAVSRRHVFLIAGSEQSRWIDANS